MFEKKPAWAKTKEASIEKYFVKQVQARDGITYKFTSPGHVDVPDRIAIFPNGRVLFAELKRPKAKPRLGQLMEIMKLQDYGQIAVILSTKREVDECLNLVCS
jgi:hypothetical protein